jgi:hypothetical protein
MKQKTKQKTRWKGKLDMKLAVQMYKSMHRSFWDDVQEIMKVQGGDHHSLDSNQSKAARESLRYDPDLLEIFHVWWHAANTLFDTNHDGKLDKTEYAALHSKLATAMKDREGELVNYHADEEVKVTVKAGKHKSKTGILRGPTPTTPNGVPKFEDSTEYTIKLDTGAFVQIRGDQLQFAKGPKELEDGDDTTLDDDWSLDANDDGFVDESEFLNMMFQLTDLWSDSCHKREYIAMLKVRTYMPLHMPCLTCQLIHALTNLFQMMYGKVFDTPFPEHTKWNGKALVEKNPHRPSQNRKSEVTESPRKKGITKSLNKSSRLKKSIYQLGEKMRDVPDEEVLRNWRLLTDNDDDKLVSKSLAGYCNADVEEDVVLAHSITENHCKQDLAPGLFALCSIEVTFLSTHENFLAQNFVLKSVGDPLAKDIWLQTKGVCVCVCCVCVCNCRCRARG